MGLQCHKKAKTKWLSAIFPNLKLQLNEKKYINCLVCGRENFQVWTNPNLSRSINGVSMLLKQLCRNFAGSTFFLFSLDVTFHNSNSHQKSCVCYILSREFFGQWYGDVLSVSLGQSSKYESIWPMLDYYLKYLQVICQFVMWDVHGLWVNVLCQGKNPP